MIDLTISPEGARTRIEGNTEAGIDFVDAWVLGVIEVGDAGRIVVTTEVVAEAEAEAVSQGLTIEREL